MWIFLLHVKNNVAFFANRLVFVYMCIKQYVREEVGFEHDALHSLIYYFFIFVLIKIYENRKHYLKNTIF